MGRVLASLDDTAIDQELEYQSLDAGRFRSRIEDILAQLFGHSWYHRGQIAMLVRASGGQPAVTDLIFWTRESIAESGEGHEVREGDHLQLVGFSAISPGRNRIAAWPYRP